MRTLFSTVGTKPNIAFRLWRETMNERIAPVEQTKLGEGNFTGTVEAADFGGLLVTRTSSSPIRVEVTPAQSRRLIRSDALIATIKLGGLSTYSLGDREAVQRAGDLLVTDASPAVSTTVTDSQTLAIIVPRERLENMLGSVRLYAGLTIGSSQGSTRLATSFFNELVHVYEQLDPHTAARMSSIGLDLIVASIAERLAQEVPKPLHGTVIVQRAKAYVEVNLGDPTLDPSQLAAAVGVSLRRLQELFHERGRHVSDWIWERRLETAARHLADCGHAHVAIGVLAYGCGFVSPSHFARRFKERFGMSPGEYRRMAV